MNDVIEIFYEPFKMAKPFLRIALPLLLLLFGFSTIFRFLEVDSFSLFDFLSELKECIFYREKFTCRMDAEKCAVFEDENEIDIGEFKCSEHCEHYGKCVNCMFYDYEEDKYICGKCHHRQERRAIYAESLNNVENNDLKKE